MKWEVEITDDEITARIVDERLDEAGLTLGVNAEKTDVHDEWSAPGYYGEDRIYATKKDAMRCVGAVMAMRDQDWEDQGIENIIKEDEWFEEMAAIDELNHNTGHPYEDWE